MKKVSLIATAFALSMICTVISPVFAVVFTPAPPTITEITGSLGGADYLLRIPSNFNGRLIVECRGYSHLLSSVNLTSYANTFNPIIKLGYAYAASYYGAGGYCVKEGIIRTHQLTEWVINNYQVTGKVYLVGISMGGNIALELGAKYPELYAGVLELAGTKDLITRYYLHSYYASITDDNALIAAVEANGGLNPPAPLTSIAQFRNYCTNAANDVMALCGGTPEEKPQAYERFSPTYSATNIVVPTMTVHGTADALVPYNQSVIFLNTVVAAGYSDLYRFYKVVGGQHCNTPVMSQILVRFPQLVNWVENGVLPPASDTP